MEPRFDKLIHSGRKCRWAWENPPGTFSEIKARSGGPECNSQRSRLLASCGPGAMRFVLRVAHRSETPVQPTGRLDQNNPGDESHAGSASS